MAEHHRQLARVHHELALVPSIELTHGFPRGINDLLVERFEAC
jgi:hypothetical protein